MAAYSDNWSVVPNEKLEVEYQRLAFKRLVEEGNATTFFDVDVCREITLVADQRVCLKAVATTEMKVYHRLIGLMYMSVDNKVLLIDGAVGTSDGNVFRLNLPPQHGDSGTAWVDGPVAILETIPQF